MIDDRDDLRSLVHAYLEGRADAAQMADLSGRITHDPAAARSVAEWMLLTSDLGEQLQTPDLTPVAAKPITASPRRFPRFAVAAALLLAGVTLAIVAYVIMHHASPAARPGEPRGRMVAVVQGAADLEFNSTPVAIGDEIYGEPIAIRRGVLQIELLDGGSALLHGPVDVTFDSPTHAHLNAGWMRIRGVPGFTVDLPHDVTVIDESTEFEVSVGPEGAAAVRVIEGRVRVLSGAGAFSERSLNVGQTLLIDPTGKAAEEATDIIYASGIDRRPIVDVRLPSTGAGLAAGDADPHWTVVRRGGDEPAIPAPARVIRFVQPEYIQPGASEVRWLGAGEPDGRAASDTMFTYAATFDLDDLDPTTVRIAGRLSADNSVRAIRVNGTPVEISGGQLAGFRDWLPFSIDRGFVAGRNVVEFDVRNEVDPEPLSPMGLMLEWSATGLPDWIGRD